MAEGMAKGGSSGGAATELAVGMAIAQQMMKDQGGFVLGASGAAGTPAAGGATPPPVPPGIPELLTPADAAKALGVTEADVMASIEAGDLKAKKIGSAFRITRAALDQFLAH
jgi:excisionase family DNA binding protein